MAWTFDAAGALTQGNADTPFALSQPASSGGILIGVVSARPASGNAGSWNAPSGYTILAQTAFGASGIGIAIVGRVATGSDTCTLSSSAAATNAVGRLLRYQGGSLTVHGSNTQQNDNSAQDMATPGVTITNPNTLEIMVASRANNDVTSGAGINSWPGGLATRTADGSAFGFAEMSLLIGDRIQTTATTLASGSIDITSTALVFNYVAVAVLDLAGAASSIAAQSRYYASMRARNV